MIPILEAFLIVVMLLLVLLQVLGNFWSASVAWMLTRESFYVEDITWVNMLKFKASFGQQEGNDDILYPGVLGKELLSQFGSI